MNVIETKLKGCYIIEPSVYKDGRGLFFEAYQKSKLEEGIGRKVDFIQENVSISRKGVLRGLHFQNGLDAQAKLIQVLKGKVLDVIVDLRKDSSTYGQHVKLKISAANRKSIFIPKGMAHGFLALATEVVFTYMCDAYYNPTSEKGIIFNDPDLGIDWNFPENKMLLSEKDLNLPLFKTLKF